VSFGSRSVKFELNVNAALAAHSRSDSIPLIRAWPPLVMIVTLSGEERELEVLPVFPEQRTVPPQSMAEPLRLPADLVVVK